MATSTNSSKTKTDSKKVSKKNTASKNTQTKNTNKSNKNSPSTKPAVRHDPSPLDILAQKVSDAFRQQNFEQGKAIILNEVLPIAPNHPMALNHLAFADYALGNFDNAYTTAINAVSHADTADLADIYATLTNITHALQRFEESRYYARLALAHKKQNVADNQAQPLPKRKRKGLHADKTKNVISFALTQDDHSTCETAVLNAALVSAIYPNWTCRFYADSCIPAHVIDRLEQHHAEIITMDKNQESLPCAFWSLLVLSDPNVHCFMVRDVQALLSHKERVAVEAWLESKKYFHIMKDSLTHYEPITAGLWAGYTGVFDDIYSDMLSFCDENTANVQSFINAVIYPTVAQSVLVHDSYALDDEALPYPPYLPSDIEKIPHFHLGLIDSSIRTTAIYVEPSHRHITWYLLNENQQSICHYQGIAEQTQDGRFAVMVHLPYFYGKNLDAGRWHIQYQPMNP